MLREDEEDLIIDQEEELYEHHRMEMPAGLIPVRIDKYIQNKLEGISRNKIQNGIRAGAVRVNNGSIKPNHKLKPFDVITILLPKPPAENAPVKPQNIPIDIVYEDDDVLVVNKAAGLVVHPGVGNPDGTLVNALAYHFKEAQLPVMEGNLYDRPGLVHRIDKDTSGLLVIAKNEYAMTHLAKQFFDHSIHREYQAIVWGEPDPKEGTINEWLGRDPKNRQQMIVFQEQEAGKEAITHYKILEDLYYVSLIQCNLETGRTHQIRAHMRYIGHSIFNDERYGGNRILKGTIYTKYKQFVENCFGKCPRQALHAKTLGFIHPVSGKQMWFDSEMPEDMLSVLDSWRHYLAYRKNIVRDE